MLKKINKWLATINFNDLTKRTHQLEKQRIADIMADREHEKENNISHDVGDNHKRNAINVHEVLLASERFRSISTKISKTIAEMAAVECARCFISNNKDFKKNYNKMYNCPGKMLCKECVDFIEGGWSFENASEYCSICDEE